LSTTARLQHQGRNEILSAMFSLQGSDILRIALGAELGQQRELQFKRWFEEGECEDWDALLLTCLGVRIFSKRGGDHSSENAGENLVHSLTGRSPFLEEGGRLGNARMPIPQQWLSISPLSPKITSPRRLPGASPRLPAPRGRRVSLTGDHASGGGLRNPEGDPPQPTAPPKPARPQDRPADRRPN